MSLLRKIIDGLCRHWHRCGSSLIALHQCALALVKHLLGQLKALALYLFSSGLGYAEAKLVFSGLSELLEV